VFHSPIADSACLFSGQRWWTPSLPPQLFHSPEDVPAHIATSFPPVDPGAGPNSASFPRRLSFLFSHGGEGLWTVLPLPPLNQDLCRGVPSYSDVAKFPMPPLFLWSPSFGPLSRNVFTKAAPRSPLRRGEGGPISRDGSFDWLSVGGTVHG